MKVKKNFLSPDWDNDVPDNKSHCESISKTSMQMEKKRKRDKNNLSFIKQAKHSENKDQLLIAVDEVVDSGAVTHEKKKKKHKKAARVSSELDDATVENHKKVAKRLKKSQKNVDVLDKALIDNDFSNNLKKKKKKKVDQTEKGVGKIQKLVEKTKNLTTNDSLANQNQFKEKGLKQKESSGSKADSTKSKRTLKKLLKKTKQMKLDGDITEKESSPTPEKHKLKKKKHTNADDIVSNTNCEIKVKESKEKRAAKKARQRIEKSKRKPELILGNLGAGQVESGLSKTQRRRLRKLLILKEKKQVKLGNDEKNTTIIESNNTSKKSFKIEKLKEILKVGEKGKESGGVVRKGKHVSGGTLKQRLMEKLKGSRFRFINEQLYSIKGHDASKMFADDPEAFEAYHKGYKHQIKNWPINPLDEIIKEIKKMPVNFIIADFGCGEARLSTSVKQTVHSFDLVALNDNVTACDMAHCPLENSSADVAVFCLSLMGTNLKDYFAEANRVLKTGGLLKIAEVSSRFTDVLNFIVEVQKYGFKNITKNFSSDMFYFVDFKKQTEIKSKGKLPQLKLNPCYYKKR